MIFYLHYLSEQIKGFNVFSYVTFRAIAAAITAFMISLPQLCAPVADTRPALNGTRLPGGSSR